MSLRFVTFAMLFAAAGCVSQVEAPDESKSAESGDDWEPVDVDIGRTNPDDAPPPAAEGGKAAGETCSMDSFDCAAGSLCAYDATDRPICTHLVCNGNACRPNEVCRPLPDDLTSGECAPPGTQNDLCDGAGLGERHRALHGDGCADGFTCKRVDPMAPEFVGRCQSNAEAPMG